MADKQRNDNNTYVECGNSSISVRAERFRTLSNFYIWLLRQNLKTKSKNLALWEL